MSNRNVLASGSSANRLSPKMGKLTLDNYQYPKDYETVSEKDKKREK